MFEHVDPAPWQSEFLARNRLQNDYLQTAARFFDPLAALLAELSASPDKPLLIGLNGSQGSGKSTLCDYLVAALQARYGLGAVALSLDDFYLTRDARQQLADTVHPLLATRGVPGTHDLGLLHRTLESLRGGGLPTQAMAVPAFDKSLDERAPVERWPRVTLPLQLVLLEGWCLGARSEDAAAVQAPINRLETEEDPQGHWRAFANRALSEDFEPFYEDIDFWIMLAAPGFEQVLQWRTEQERKLAATVDGVGSGLMDEEALARFVAHFERHTRHCLRHMPDTVDVLLQLDEQRRVVSSRGLGTAG
ncbi:MAG: D-glycerate 3-kinase [Halieaceae bacterium]